MTTLDVIITVTNVDEELAEKAVTVVADTTGKIIGTPTRVEILPARGARGVEATLVVDLPDDANSAYIDALGTTIRNLLRMQTHRVPARITVDLSST